MLPPDAPYGAFAVVSCGPDWLTCTSKKSGVSNALQDWAMAELYKEKACDGQISQARRLGYAGWSGSGLFVGERPKEVLVQLTGPRCSPLAMEAITLSSNVSRLDLQVTVWTEGEQPALAEWTYKKLKERAAVSYVPFEFSLIVNHPQGATLNLGRRISDHYGRLYDKTAQLGKVTPRLLWRYEVEWKRKAARRQAMQLLEQRCSPTHVCKQVHAWYTKKGVQPSFSTSGNPHAEEAYITTPTRDVLSWFRDSVSITIAKAINRHGRVPVLSALGLMDHTQGGTINAGTASAQPIVASDAAFDSTQPTVSERVLLH